MNDADVDEIGIRITPPNLAYTNNGQTSRWFGSGILDKPIGDFLSAANRLVVNNPGNYPYGYLAWSTDFVTTPSLPVPYFTSAGFIHVHLHPHIIPEPEEYALVFGLFALAFVIIRRRFQKKGLN